MKLKLHEAMAVVLMNIPNRTATADEIAKEINRRQLYLRKDLGQLPAYQVKMRAKLSNGNYSKWFEWIEPTTVKLK